MRFSLPKNRIAPLVIFALISIIVSLILGLYYLNSLAKYSYKTRLENCDTLAEHTANLISQEIQNNYQYMQAFADLAAGKEDLSRDNITSLLSSITKDGAYVDAVILGTDGKGYNIAGDEVDASKEAYFINALEGKRSCSDGITYTSEHIPVMIYSVPVIKDGVTKGVFITKVNAQLKDPAIFQKEAEDGSLIYLVNGHNDLVSFAQDTDADSFDYNSLIAGGTFYKDHEKALEAMNLRDYFTSDNRKAKIIWDRKPLGINDWYVLVGRTDSISPSTRSILRLTNLLWIFITICTVLIFVIMIITQRKANQKVSKSLYLDPVTGGDNWYKFRINVSKILNSKQFLKKKYALINFDINRFKIINDAYGYQKGDEVLKDIYYVIKKWAKQGEPFTRYAADQFYILMAFQEEDEVSERIEDLNERIHRLKYTSVSKIFFGVYYIAECQDSIDRMGEFASIAKNNVKGNTEGIISFFDDAARGRLLEEEEIEKSMNKALRNDEFQVFLQPKYTAKEEKVSGAEALVRWFNGKGTMLSPGYFIPVFEKNGFITELDYYMLRKVCEVIRDWLDKGYSPLPISVNISRLHFANPNLAQIIKDIVDNYGVPHNLIELELTESAFLQNKQMLVKTVTQLRDFGFLVSMDDFGAGYSSLNSLKDLPLDVVKLDGELFRITDEVERGLTVIRNTITMAKDLHMMVVAECIETREQVEFLCTVGCDIIQGYYFAKPMPVEQFEERYFSLAAMD